MQNVAGSLFSEQSERWHSNHSNSILVGQWQISGQSWCLWFFQQAFGMRPGSSHLEIVLFWQWFLGLQKYSRTGLEENYLCCWSLWFRPNKKSPLLPLIFFVRQRHISNSHEHRSLDGAIQMLVDLLQILITAIRTDWNDQSPTWSQLINQLCK